jgi:GLPGLI family protein
MKKLIFTIHVLTVIGSSLYAQNVRFVRSGIITYKKTVNMYAIIQRGINKENEAFLKPAFEEYKQQHPQFKELESTLTFVDNKSIFTPTDKATSVTSFFDDPQISLQNNVVYSDLDAKQLISKKKVFNDIYLLRDTLKNIKWKFTDEVRDIAGYTCHRANGIILDSVYVVAFYTDRIPVSGGPESFGGLPGMILQLVLPHENVSWIATKMEDINLKASSILPPKGGTLVNIKELLDKLRNVYRENKKNGSTDLKAFLL